MCKKIISVVMSLLIVMSMFAGLEISSVAEDDILSYLTYEINDGEVTITGCDTSISGDIVIPDTIQGYPVTTIGNYAFKNCDNLSTITIPDSVTTLKSFSFAGCGITELELPYSVKKLERYVFGYFTNISTVTINYPYCDIAEQGTGMDPSIPYEITLIGYSGSSAEKYADIYGYTFIPLEDEFSTEVPTVSGDDILEHITYEIKDGKVTIMDFDAYIGGDVVIPDTIEGFPVTTIYHFAFSSCYWITSVKLPDSLTNLMPSAFPHCQNLEKITMGTGIKSIPWVFSGCKNLSTVYYKGTAEEWASIRIIDDYYLSNANIIYNWQEPLPEEPTTEDPTTKEPETEDPTTEPNTKEPETQAPSSEPTTKEPETQAPETKPNTKPVEKPNEAPVSGKLAVKGNTVKVDDSKKLSTINAMSSVADVAKSITNSKYAIVDKNGKALKKDALVGTGSKIQIMDNNNKVIGEYTVVVPTDVDGNGKTSAADARLALRASAKLETGVVGAYAKAADMSADGKVTAADARKILRISAGLDKI